MKYYRPVKSTQINQWFGENKNPLYKQLGMLGHNGIDFGAPDGTKGYWYGSDIGTLIKIGYDYLGGNYCVVLTEEEERFYKHVFYHLKEVVAKTGQVLESGDLMYITDNTGKGTTGPHLHAIEIKEVSKDENGNWKTLNKNNGYFGAIDPAPKFVNIFILDYMETLKKQIGILQKLVVLWKKIKDLYLKIKP